MEQVSKPDQSESWKNTMGTENCGCALDDRARCRMVSIANTLFTETSGQGIKFD